MNSYLLFKSLHLIAVISWMAGLLYLPRIFVYHTENHNKNETIDIFKIMERKLFYYIMFPAMVFGRGLGAIDHASTEPTRLLFNPTYLMPD